MKNLILLLGAFISLNAAASPVGSYYTPFEDHGDDGYSPEQLFVFSDSTLTVSHVDNGARIVTATSYKIQGNKIILNITNSPEVTWNCNGEETTYEANSASDIVSQYVVDAQGITLQSEEGTMVLNKATQEQIARIQSLPLCTKN